MPFGVSFKKLFNFKMKYSFSKNSNINRWIGTLFAQESKTHLNRPAIADSANPSKKHVVSPQSLRFIFFETFRLRMQKFDRYAFPSRDRSMTTVTERPFRLTSQS
jgi:hypothetical protein